MIAQQLAAIPGISNVTVEDSVNAYSQKEERYYTFFYEQLINHANPSEGTFKQRVRIHIGKNGLKAPVVLNSCGYNMPDDVKDAYDPEMSRCLTASTLWIEHRYFGKSQPEPEGNIEFTYLYADQAAQDLHAIVSLLKQTFFKESDKWVCTGTSKDGITAGLYAYYSDQYGWDDIDLYVPFCAPFLEGTPESCDDVKIGQYMYLGSCSGYPQGSVEDLAYQRLRQIPTALIQNKELRDTCLRLFHQMWPKVYIEVINTFGRDEEKATAGLLYTYFMEYLYDRLTSLPFNQWAPLVPDINDTERVASFIMMPKETLSMMIVQLNGDIYNNYEDYYSEDDDEPTAEAPAVREPKVKTDQEILDIWRIDPDMPYCVQAVRELGNIRLDLSSLEGLNFPESSTDFGFLAASVSRQFETSTLYHRYAHQWDGGQLMKSFRQWLKTQDKFNMIFCYSANDPWTGGAIDESTNPRVKRLICRNGIHHDNFLNPAYYTEAEQQELLNYILYYLYSK